MLETLITSKTRIKLLLKFFLNSSTTSYLRDLEQEFGESTNAIRIELNRFEKAGMLSSKLKGNRKYYHANTSHPLFYDMKSILMKYIGIDTIVDKVLLKLGELQRAYLTGDFARGIDSMIIDLVLVGSGIDRNYLAGLAVKAEKMVGRKIRYVVMNDAEANEYMSQHNHALLLWQADK